MFTKSKEEFNKSLKVNLTYQNMFASKRDYYVLYFREKYLEMAKNEFNILKKHFPNVDFSAELRIKSPESSYTKYSHDIDEGKNGDISDIFANTYIINSVDGNSDEKVLTDMCFKFKYFLTHNIPNAINIPEKEKNYIDEPKCSTYQALHITRDHGKYEAETQIKTKSMYQNATYGKARHNGLYKQRHCSLLQLPERFEYILDKNGFCTAIKEIPVERSFEEFFGVPYSTDYFLDLTHD